MSNWLDGLYLYLGRCAPNDCNANKIKDALLNRGSVCVICVSDEELIKIKNGLKKTTTLSKDLKEVTIYDKGTSNEICSFVNLLENQNLKNNCNIKTDVNIRTDINIRPSDVKNASKLYKQIVEKDLQKHQKAVEKMKIIQENSRKRAELSREQKSKEIKAKIDNNFNEEAARQRLEDELKEKDRLMESEFEHIV